MGCCWSLFWSVGNNHHSYAEIEDVREEILPSQFSQKYTLGNVIGEGTTATVFSMQAKGRKDTSRMMLACKVIYKKKLRRLGDHPDTNDIINQLRKEIDVLKSISHPNIVAYVDYMETKTRIFIVTQKISGNELFDYVSEKGSFSEAKARHIIQCVVSALVYLHDRGIVHRDLKAENVIYEETKSGPFPTVKLIDFGFSTILHHDLAGSFLGTSGYLAPEIRQNRHYNASVDNWALGVLTYVLLSSQFPFEPGVEELPKQRDLCRKHFKLVFPEGKWSNISVPCKDFIKKLLEVDPMLRMTAKQASTHPWIRGGMGSVMIRGSAGLQKALSMMEVPSGGSAGHDGGTFSGGGMTAGRECGSMEDMRVLPLTRSNLREVKSTMSLDARHSSVLMSSGFRSDYGAASNGHAPAADSVHSRDLVHSELDEQEYIDSKIEGDASGEGVAVVRMPHDTQQTVCPQLDFHLSPLSQYSSGDSASQLVGLEDFLSSDKSPISLAPLLRSSPRRVDMDFTQLLESDCEDDGDVDGHSVRNAGEDPDMQTGVSISYVDTMLSPLAALNTPIGTTLPAVLWSRIDAMSSAQGTPTESPMVISPSQFSAVSNITGPSLTPRNGECSSLVTSPEADGSDTGKEFDDSWGEETPSDISMSFDRFSSPERSRAISGGSLLHQGRVSASLSPRSRPGVAVAVGTPDSCVSSTREDDFEYDDDADDDANTEDDFVYQQARLLFASGAVAATGSPLLSPLSASDVCGINGTSTGGRGGKESDSRGSSPYQTGPDSPQSVVSSRISPPRNGPESDLFRDVLSPIRPPDKNRPFREDVTGRPPVSPFGSPQHNGIQ